MKQVFLYVTLFFIIVLAIGCTRHSSEWNQMYAAEQIMETNPDSALLILESIQEKNLIGDEERARYALLKSIAFDKNYIDTTTLDVLQPAIDYYLKKVLLTRDFAHITIRVEFIKTKIMTSWQSNRLLMLKTLKMRQLIHYYLPIIL